jgi:hypothetical protein
MPSARWVGRQATRVLLFLLAASLSSLLLAQVPPTDPGFPPGPEEPWDKEPPDVVVPGEKTEEGVEFESPFLIGVSSLAAQFVNCATGEMIPAEGIEAEYYFSEGAEAPYDVGDLRKIVVWASGYLPKEITEFRTFSVNLFLVTLTILYPAEGNVVCLTPSSGRLDATFADAGSDPGPVPPIPPSPAPGTCGTVESQREVWKVVYHPTSVNVVRGQNAKGGLETTFHLSFDREEFWKARDRGPCTLSAGHSGAHVPWEWSAWREDGSETTLVTFTQTIGGWPEGMSATYFEGWVLGFCHQDLAGMGLTTLRYVEGSFDAKAYYDLHIKPQLEMG